MATTVTPGSTAPLESATVPLICAVACAHALVAASRRTAPTRTPLKRFIQMPPRRVRITNVAEKNRKLWPYGKKLAGSIHPLAGRQSEQLGGVAPRHPIDVLIREPVRLHCAQKSRKTVSRQRIAFLAKVR